MLQIFHTNTFIVVVTLIESVLSLPWQLYDTFVIEEKHGFNKQVICARCFPWFCYRMNGAVYLEYRKDIYKNQMHVIEAMHIV